MTLFCVRSNRSPPPTSVAADALICIGPWGPEGSGRHILGSWPWLDSAPSTAFAIWSSGATVPVVRPSVSDLTAVGPAALICSWAKVGMLRAWPSKSPAINHRVNIVNGSQPPDCPLIAWLQRSQMRPVPDSPDFHCVEIPNTHGTLLQTACRYDRRER